MSIKFCDKYEAEGPYSDTTKLKNESGVYVILSFETLLSDSLIVIDVGESHALKDRVENHDRKNCWKRHGRGTIKYAAYYTPHKQQTGRMQVEQEIRSRYNPSCGDR